MSETRERAGSNRIEVPARTSKGDVALAAARAATGAVPFAGAALSELLSLTIQTPLAQRQHRWMEVTSEVVEELRDRAGISPEQLADSEEFVDTVLDATRIALRTRHEEKRAALRNAIFNSATQPAGLSEAERHEFIRLIDDYSVWHLKLLQFFADPASSFDSASLQKPEYFSAGLGTLLEARFDELNGQREFYDQIWRRLYSDGMSRTESLHVMMTGRGIYESRVTSRGMRFLSMIEREG